MIKITIHKDWSRAAWDIRAFEYGHKGDIIPYEITIKKLPEISEGSFIPATFSFRDQTGEMKQIIDALKEALVTAGFMSEQSGLEGELKATKKHLEFSEKIVDKFLGEKSL